MGRNGPNADNDDTSQRTSPGYHLRYIDEFVRLRSAPLLLELGVYPDAKEITEAMGAFEAMRAFVQPNIIPTSSGGGDIDRSDSLGNGAQHLAQPAEVEQVRSAQNQQARRRCIICVGDGSTPRSAALFAVRCKEWEAVAIDPMLRPLGENPKKLEPKAADRSLDGRRIPRVIDHTPSWSHRVQRLTVYQAKIQDVQISCDEAIIVLLHAHVSLHDVLNAVDCPSIHGLITLPCCQYIHQHRRLWNRGPDIAYHDASIASPHNEIRIWTQRTSGTGQCQLTTKMGQVREYCESVTNISGARNAQCDGPNSTTPTSAASNGELHHIDDGTPNRRSQTGNASSVGDGAEASSLIQSDAGSSALEDEEKKTTRSCLTQDIPKRYQRPSDDQTSQLKAAFSRQTYYSNNEIDALAASIGLSSEQCKQWFKKRRKQQNKNNNKSRAKSGRCADGTNGGSVPPDTAQLTQPSEWRRYAIATTPAPWKEAANARDLAAVAAEATTSLSAGEVCPKAHTVSSSSEGVTMNAVAHYFRPSSDVYGDNERFALSHGIVVAVRKCSNMCFFSIADKNDPRTRNILQICVSATLMKDLSVSAVAASAGEKSHASQSGRVPLGEGGSSRILTAEQTVRCWKKAIKVGDWIQFCGMLGIPRASSTAAHRGKPTMFCWQMWLVGDVESMGRAII